MMEQSVWRDIAGDALLALAEREARSHAGMTVIPARRFVNEQGQTIYSKVRLGTMVDLPAEEADCFLCSTFMVVEAASLRSKDTTND